MSKWFHFFRDRALTTILTGAVLGALLLQVNLLSGELELQRQHFTTYVGEMASGLNERVRLFVRRKSMGVMHRSPQNLKDSTVTLQTASGTTTLSWSSAQVPNPYGMGLDTAVLGGFLENFQSALPWESQITVSELDSIILEELQRKGVQAKPQWAVVENGYLTSLSTKDFKPSDVSFNYVLAESFFGPTRQLVLYFPGEKFYLARRVYLSLLAALLFSGVILSAFFGVQRERNRQKRLADVKSDFINNMSHEFKTPLATINLAVDALLKNGDRMTPDRFKDYLGVIKSENKRMNAQMESVLQMSLLDKEEFTIDRSNLDLKTVVQEAVEHFQLTVEERQGWLDLNIEGEYFPYEGDPTHLKSAVTNLIDNGIKYSSEHPQVSVSLRERESEYTISVTDKGVGMDQGTLNQVFDRFFRATKGNIHDVKGHGLGLAFVKEIVEKHEGNIDVTSEMGEGSTFTIHLPKTELHGK